jgi:hypothetical protein
MARSPKPWFRKQTGWWMVTPGGQQHKLAEGRDNKRLAQKKFHELSLLVGEAPESGNTQVAHLCDTFLQWSQRHQSAETYRGYFFYLQSFSEACGYLPVMDLRPYRRSGSTARHGGRLHSSTRSVTPNACSIGR